jgi:protein-L-isoaspartate(D-aspartate) O-methyltransferase
MFCSIGISPLYEVMASSQTLISAPLAGAEAARLNMVNGQIRPNRVNDPRLIEAMRHLPREQFLPSQLADQAYVDRDIKLGAGRVMMAPMSVARLVQACAARPGEHCLVVGAGTGYGTALLAATGAEIIALESDPALAEIGRAACASCAPDVQWQIGDLAAGSGGHGPFDIIMIEGAVSALPRGLAAQLKPTGRMICVLVEGGIGRIVMAEARAGGIAHVVLYDCMTAILPGFAAPSGFSFQANTRP